MSARYRCWNPDTGDADDGRDVIGVDVEDAAETFARWYDAKSADYIYATDGGLVAVRLDHTTEVFTLRVTGEQCISYRARVQA